MPLRVYCPDCAAPLTAPAVGARVTCRVCDRVFRAGTRVGRRDRHEDPTRQEAPDGSRPLLIVLGGIAVLMFGLVLGCGLAGWFFLMRQPACPPPDDEIIMEDDEGPPPVLVNLGPVKPGRLGDEDR